MKVFISIIKHLLYALFLLLFFISSSAFKKDNLTIALIFCYIAVFATIFLYLAFERAKKFNNINKWVPFIILIFMFFIAIFIAAFETTIARSY